MPPTWSPYDIAVGNNMLPLYQMLARNQRWVDPAVRGRWPEESVEPPPEAMSAPLAMPPLRSRSPTELLRRQRTPVGSIPAGAPARTAEQPPRAAPAAQGVAGMVTNLTPAERDQLRSSMLAGAASNLSNLLAQRPQAGLGEILLAAGAGGLAGRAAGQQGIRLGQQQELETQLAQANLGLAQSKAARAEQERQALQGLIEDPSTPPEQKRFFQSILAGVPAGAAKGLLPETMSPYQARSLELREQEIARRGELTPYQQRSLALQEAALERRGQMTPYQEATLALREREMEEGRGRDLTALQRNVPFVAQALNIPESEATQMMLASASSRKTDEDLATDFAKAYVQNSFGAADPEEAATFGREMVQRLRGGGATTPTSPAEAPTPESYSVFDPRYWMGGEEEESAPVEAASPEAMALPEADTDVSVGQTITLDDGSVWRKRGPDDYVQVR